MKLGLLADIHEETRDLQKAIAVLQEHGAERFVVLGDVFETGKRIEDGRPDSFRRGLTCQRPG